MFISRKFLKNRMKASENDNYSKYYCYSARMWTDFRVRVSGQE